MGTRANILPTASDRFTAIIALAVSLSVSLLLFRTTLSAAITIVASTFAAVLITLIACRVQRERLNAVLRREFHLKVAELSDIQKKLERDRISRELHDGVCPTLLAARVWLEQAVQLSATRDDCTELCSRGLAEIESALLEMRRISHGLEPALLGNRGFADTLRHVGCEFGKRTHIDTRVLGTRAGLDKRLSSESQAALVRITQEALANIEKHSAASRVVVELRANEDSLTLTITDDGHSFCQIASRNSEVKVGLNNMRARLVEIGGILTLRFAPDGTQVMAQVPLKAAEPDSKRTTQGLSTGASL